MVSKVSAWAADDGKLFPTEREAATHDARENLKALGIFNDASINAIMSRADEVLDAVKALADILAAQPKHKDVNNAKHD